MEKKIIIGQNMIEFEMDGRVELRFSIKNEADKLEKLDNLTATHPDAILVDRSNVQVNMQQFASINDFDWTQSLIFLSAQ